MNKINHTASFWDERYQTGDIGWDLGQISPPLKAYIDQLEDRSQAILIPGCGNAYEAEYLLKKGFLNITLIDISPTLTALIRQKFSTELDKWIRIYCQDFFDHLGRYDLILEQTFFCALDPTLRKNYVKQMHQLLLPGGKLAGLLFNRSFDSNPPYGGSVDVYQPLFSSHFQIQKMEACGNSAAPRANSELFVLMEKIG